MNVGFYVLGWLKLNDEVNVRDVETSRGYVSGDQHLEFGFSEACTNEEKGLTLECDLSLGLGNVAVKHLCIDLDAIGEDDLVRISLGLREDDGLPVETAVTHH